MRNGAVSSKGLPKYFRWTPYIEFRPELSILEHTPERSVVLNIIPDIEIILYLSEALLIPSYEENMNIE